MAAVPVFKLGVLLIKQLTKPVANYIKQEAVGTTIYCVVLGNTPLPPDDLYKHHPLQLIRS